MLSVRCVFGRGGESYPHESDPFVTLPAAERTKLQIRLARANARLETLKSLVRNTARVKIRNGLRADIRSHEKLIAEIGRKLADR